MDNEYKLTKSENSLNWASDQGKVDESQVADKVSKRKQTPPPPSPKVGPIVGSGDRKLIRSRSVGQFVLGKTRSGEAVELQFVVTGKTDRISESSEDAAQPDVESIVDKIEGVEKKDLARRRASCFENDVFVLPSPKHEVVDEVSWAVKVTVKFEFLLLFDLPFLILRNIQSKERKKERRSN